MARNHRGDPHGSLTNVLHPQWFKRMERWLGDSSLQPLVNIAKLHESTYGAMQRFIENRRASCGSLKSIPPAAGEHGAGQPPAGPAHGLQNRAAVRALFHGDGRENADGATPILRHKPIITPPAVVANDALVTPLVDAPQANDALLDNEDLA